MPSEHFKFSPDILKRLGEELVPSYDVGILELVRNAYDADASRCDIKLLKVNKAGGTIIVSDDGTGMTVDSIRDGWLLLGKSSKRTKTLTPRGRVPVGEKGLGRLAALRLGRSVHLKTRPASVVGAEYLIDIDWRRFDRAATVSDVDIPVQQARTRALPGTDVEISNLKVALTSDDVERLAKNLLLISGPFEGVSDFKVSLYSREFTQLERKVKDAYFGDAEYHMVATVDANGNATLRVFDWRKKLLWHTKGPRRYATAPTIFDFWAFLIDSRNAAPRRNPIGEVRAWLKELGGVYCFENGMRVNPYGGGGSPDWLNLNLSRSRSPEERPSTNNSIGRLAIDNSRGLLKQKTDRSGYIENKAFSEMRAFAIDALNWMAKRRLEEAEKRREAARQDIERRRAEAERVLSAAVESLIVSMPKDGAASARSAAKKVVDASRVERRALRQELQFYRALATVGMVSAVFSHETAAPIARVRRYANTLKNNRLVAANDDLSSAVQSILTDIAGMTYSTRLPMELLRSEKRAVGNIDLNEVIEGSVSLLRPLLSRARVDMKLALSSRKPFISGSAALIESVIVNLTTNALTAFQTTDSSKKRILSIKTEIRGEWVDMTFSDSGPGIDTKKIALNEIWLPGQTTNDSGTGFGLTIVRDTVADLSGRVSVEAHGQLGGATFEVLLPLIRG